METLVIYFASFILFFLAFLSVLLAKSFVQDKNWGVGIITLIIQLSFCGGYVYHAKYTLAIAIMCGLSLGLLFVVYNMKKDYITKKTSTSYHVIVQDYTKRIRDVLAGKIQQR